MGFRVLIYILLADYYFCLALECNEYQIGDFAVLTKTCLPPQECEVLVQSNNNTWMYHSLRCNVCEERNFTTFGVEYRVDCCNTSFCSNDLFQDLKPTFLFKRINATSNSISTSTSTRLHLPTSTGVHQPTTTLSREHHSLTSQTAIASTTPSSSSSDDSDHENSITIITAVLIFVIIIVSSLLALCMYSKNNKSNEPTQRQDSPPVELQQIVLPSRTVVPPSNYNFPIQETSSL